MKLTKLTMSLAACLSATTALAADLPSRKAPVYLPPPPIFTWTGFHLGFNAGATFGGSRSITNVAVPTFNNGSAGAAAVQPVIESATTGFIPVRSLRAAILGVQAGYDYQFANSFVVGLEADVQGVIGPTQRNVFGGLGAGAVGAAGFGFAATTVASKRLDWLGTVRGRIGYLITPSFLIYATGGLAYGGVKASSATYGVFAGAAINPVAGQGGYSTNKVGYTAGAGLEYMFAPGWSVKAEYLYYDLRSATFSGGALSAVSAAGTLGTVDAIRTRVRYDGQLSRVGVNYHFWAPPSAVVARY